jgi:hypothetical protein
MKWLLLVHIGVVGYWLGAELVINSTYRLACFANDLSLAARTKLMDHVIRVDQHVRYALVLQMTFGLILAITQGYIPAGEDAVFLIAILGAVFLSFVEVVHRLRWHAWGPTLALADRALRYILIAVFLVMSVGTLDAISPIAFWLRVKLAAFAAVMACGIGIRLVLRKQFRAWATMAVRGATPEGNLVIRKGYIHATSILALLWLFIGLIIWLSVSKPS